MPATPNTQAIYLANQAMGLMQQLEGWYQSAQQFIAVWNTVNGANLLNALPTCATNGDGTLGTADGTPVTGHLIDIRTTNASGLNRAIAAYDLGVMENRIADVVSLMEGNAVDAQTTWPAELAKIIGG